ncbi:ComEA family DNA-binding protein [Pseudorhodoferax soli]|uniref:Competence protein ComEA n=1 Tax=Pseudorhodoferax soli TaxID=545864 RepID=A0A368Y769_9BURK|nr:helix-hairpin-helix domain-containing protein [Pseudorhodoferax soli]RCW76130.1 competence protein ComEA [Pseudorhodoferax soli]
MRALAIVLLALAAPAWALEVNQASAAELDGLRGIGPGLSTPMLDERAKAPFRDWADLMARIKGVGPGNAARFSAQGLRVNGEAYERPASAAKGSSAPR